MTVKKDKPSHSQSPSALSERFYQAHGALLETSFRHLLGDTLLDSPATGEHLIDELFKAPFALVSHGTETDPIFNFGNQTALALFEMTWDEFTQLPSRYSAEPVSRVERDALLNQVTEHGFIKDYKGVRISSTGKRFLIEDAVVWNLVDEKDEYRGQAALIKRWTFL